MSGVKGQVLCDKRRVLCSDSALTVLWQCSSIFQTLRHNETKNKWFESRIWAQNITMGKSWAQVSYCWPDFGSESERDSEDWEWSKSETYPYSWSQLSIDVCKRTKSKAQKRVPIVWATDLCDRSLHIVNNSSRGIALYLCSALALRLWPEKERSLRDRHNIFKDSLGRSRAQASEGPYAGKQRSALPLRLSLRELCLISQKPKVYTLISAQSVSQKRNKFSHIYRKNSALYKQWHWMHTTLEKKVIELDKKENIDPNIVKK